MSKYTIEVRYICENYAGLTESKGFDDIETIITEAAPQVFNFSFPIFDETYRLSLEKQILRKYYTREICEETVGLWKLRLWSKLNLIMPYYNEMYKSALLEFNPFYDVDLTRDHETVNNGSQSTQGQASNTRTDNLIKNTNDVDKTRWDLYSDTPQGGINGIEATTDSISNNAYLTNARKIIENGGTTESNTGTVSNSGSNSGSSTIQNVEDYLEHVKGKNGGRSYASLLKEYRETFLNIDKMIVDELSDLFFNLW